MVYSTNFCAANILGCLNSIRECGSFEGEGELICIRAAHFLLSEKSSRWSFNYWPRNSAEAKSMPYPDDLDDTFVTLAALYAHDPKLIDGAALAEVAKLLTAVELAPGGPYRTWLVAADSPAEWRDVDLAVNANVGYFLLLLGISLSNLTKFVDDRIRAGDLRSPYYPGPIQAIYFISRFYRGELKAELADGLLREAWKNPLESAMAISALVNLGFRRAVSDEMLAAITDRLDREGWRPCAFCIDPSRDGKTAYAGSSALTAAFCAEAFAKILAADEAISARENFLHMPAAELPSKFAKIKGIAISKCESLPESLKRVALEAVAAIEDEEIICVPYAMYEALGCGDAKVSSTITPEFLDELALANLYGWIAYSIYDDFLDGEGEPRLLSAANFFARELGAMYARFEIQAPGISAMYKKIMDRIDDANAWELAHRSTQAPAIEQLADRSLGHALPALGVVFAAGHSGRETLSSAETVLAFFTNYLIARQLHDDAHDWKEDLLRGQINSACGKLLALGKNDISNNNLEKLFWRIVIPDIAADIKKYVGQARVELANESVFKNPAPFELLLGRLESAIDRMLAEREETIRFLAAYAPVE